jgi:hypothetical protein
MRKFSIFLGLAFPAMYLCSSDCEVIGSLELNKNNNKLTTFNNLTGLIHLTNHCMIGETLNIVSEEYGVIVENYSFTLCNFNIDSK